jgi:hypothetical protein
VPCPICHSPRSSIIQKEPASTDSTRSAAYTERLVNLVACGDCTFVYVERDFPESYVNGFYEERAGGGYALNLENFFWWHEATKDSNRHILSLLGAVNRRRLLDVGCGSGPFRESDARGDSRLPECRRSAAGGTGGKGTCSRCRALRVAGDCAETYRIFRGDTKRFGGK